MALPSKINKKRIVGVVLVITILFFVLIGRIAYWTLVKGEWLQEKGESQWTQDTLVSAKRGSILDSNGNVLAQSASANTVVLRPEKVKDANAVADKLSEILGMDRDELYTKATDTSKQEVWVKRQITQEQSDQIEAANLDGVAFVVDVKRYYPNSSMLTQVLGYTSVDGEGVTGIEKEYDKYLSGKSGRIVAEKDKNGTQVSDGQQLYIEPTDGYNVTLTIDSVIQSYLEKACTEAYEQYSAKGVEGIVMDPKTGAVLAMANIPGFDLNDIPRDDSEKLQELSRNKVTADSYEPGSTFKIITTAAALDSGTVTMDSTFNCVGYKTVDGEKIKCWSTTPHGSETLTQAVENSCNPAFMEMGLNMGLDTFYDYIYNFGFGSETGIDFSSDATGIVSERKYVKNVDLARIAFGQSIAVTPLQLANAVCAAVNGGTLYKPYLVSSLTDEEGNTIESYEPTAVRQVISEDTSSKMREILKSVVDNGSGKNAQIEGYSVGGKTGTAQKYENGKIAEGKVISSFIGFAPADDPQYVVLILVDEPQSSVTYGSVVCAPYVKEVLEQTLTYANVPPTNTVVSRGDEGIDTAQTVEVPNYIDEYVYDAKFYLEEAGFSVTIKGSKEYVVSMTPAPGEQVPEGTEIILYTEEQQTGESEGGEQTMATGDTQIPDVSGLTPSEARARLAESGFKIEVIGSGTAVSQQPAAGSMGDSGDKIRVYFKRDYSSYTNSTEE